MARILITGSSAGIGLAAAQHLASKGHQVYLHARNPAKAAEAQRLVPSAAGVLVADLGDEKQVRRLAAEANALGPWDAVAHNAGIGYATGTDGRDEKGNALVWSVDMLAPYMLLGLMDKPKRVLIMTSGTYTKGDPQLEDMSWRAREIADHMQVYMDAKMQLTMLGFALARKWEETEVVIMDPGWAQTNATGGTGPDTAEVPGSLMACWTAGKVEIDSKHGKLLKGLEAVTPLPVVLDEQKQDRVITFCKEMSGVEVF